MLESQHDQLAKGLQELYRRMIRGKGWPGAPLATSITGNPLTHEVLERLGILQQATQDNVECHSDDDSIQTDFDDTYAEIHTKSSDGFTRVTSAIPDSSWGHSGSRDLSCSEHINNPRMQTFPSYPVPDTAFVDHNTSTQQFTDWTDLSLMNVSLQQDMLRSTTEDFGELCPSTSL